MKSINFYAFIILLSFTLCKATREQMLDFAKCAKNQIGKTYIKVDVRGEERGPDQFSNSGLIWSCRAQAGLDNNGTIYVSWKTVKDPIEGAIIYGIIKDYGPYVESDTLGIVIQTDPTIVVIGDEEKGVLVSKEFIPDPKYIRIEYQYIDI